MSEQSLEKELALFLPEVALSENMPPIPLHTISEFVNTGLDEGLMLPTPR